MDRYKFNDETVRMRNSDVKELTVSGSKPISRINFYGPKDVRAIEFLLYFEMKATTEKMGQKQELNR